MRNFLFKETFLSFVKNLDAAIKTFVASLESLSSRVMTSKVKQVI